MWRLTSRLNRIRCQFLGACVVQAPRGLLRTGLRQGTATAISEAHRLGLNPGGGMEPVPAVRGRLLNAKEARDMELRPITT